MSINHVNYRMNYTASHLDTDGVSSKPDGVSSKPGGVLSKPGGVSSKPGGAGNCEIQAFRE